MDAPDVLESALRAQHRATRRARPGRRRVLGRVLRHDRQHRGRHHCAGRRPAPAHPNGPSRCTGTQRVVRSLDPPARNPSSCFTHMMIWFQLALVWSTNLALAPRRVSNDSFELRLASHSVAAKDLPCHATSIQWICEGLMRRRTADAPASAIATSGRRLRRASGHKRASWPSAFPARGAIAPATGC